MTNDITRILFILLLGLCPFLPAENISPQGYLQIEDEAKEPILTPSFANRHTRKMRLDNGLEAYLISDPRAEQSAAAVCVHAGSWDDPDEYPGMAHFIEHLLFLGTKEFPEESAFDEFVHRHGGNFNAYTELDQTCYLFSIETSAFSEGLRRFASFFKEPLFSASGVNRELQAIQQEFLQHTRKDATRSWWVLQQLTSTSHPNSRFRIGNLQTLSKVPRQRLLAWYEDHYSSNVMRLVVYSPLDLETLTRLVVQDFAKVPNRALTASEGDELLFGPKMKGHMSVADALQDTRTLTLYWELPTRFMHMREEKPAEIVSHILGHEGKKSLLAALKEQRLAESLSTAASDLGGRNFFLTMQIELTKRGLKNVDQVLDCVFQALQMLRIKGAISYIFDEVQQMALVEYQYQEPQDAFEIVQNLAQMIFDEELGTFPEKGLLYRKYDPAAIQDVVNALTTENLHIHLMAPEKQLRIELTEQEPWGKTAYNVRPIPKEVIDRWHNLQPASSIDLPDSNPFIPTRLTVYAEKPALHRPKPQPIYEDEQGEAYYALDTYYQVPNIYWSFAIKTPKIDPANAEQAALADLFIKGVQDTLSADSYHARLAGLHYELKTEECSFIVTITGYSQKADQFLERIFTAMKQMRPTQAQFQDYKESLIHRYANFAKEDPLRQAVEATSAVLYRDYSTHKEKCRAIRRISYEQFQEYISTLFDKNYRQALLYGNLTAEEAKSAYTKAEKILGGEPFLVEEQQKPAVADLSLQQIPHYITLPTKMTGNAIVFTLQDSPFSFIHRAMQQLLSQAMKASFFTTLRTKQQTGYAVFNWDEELERQLFFFFAVQSDSHAGRDLLARFELFLEGFARELGQSQLTEPEFIAMQNALVSELAKMPENMRSMGALLAKLLYDYNADFDWMQKRFTAMQKVQHASLLDYSRQVLSPKNKKRLAVIVEGKIPIEKYLKYKRLRTLRELRKQLEFIPIP